MSEGLNDLRVSQSFTISNFGKEEIPDEKLAELSVLESFDKDRLKVLIDKVIVYGEDAIEIVWKVGNPFSAEITV